MKITLRSALAIAGAAALLSACAEYPYDDGYNGYGYNSGPYPYYDYPGYYAGPSVGLGFGFGYSDRGEHEHHWRHDRDDEEHHRDDH